jgi:Tfp pilus assembly protein PilF
VNRLARLAGGKLKDAALSVVILRRNVELHPASARATARLAEGYLAAGDTVTAIVEFQRAINLAPSSHTILPEDSRTKLEVLERQRTTRNNVPQPRRQ